jgi:spore coat polysaccharide biosynthesis protein SpsF
MTPALATDQENFWQGTFGDAYSDRNRGADLVAANAAFFARIIARAPGIQSILELGANIGLNLQALRQILPAVQLSAVELNARAATELSRALPDVALTVGSFLHHTSACPADLVFTKGVLIHVNPERLLNVYDLMHRISRRYILVAEYYNPTPVEVSYRGHTARLFKRDFAGEMLTRFPDLCIVDYGFVYHRDPVFPQDDLTWFLLEKNHDTRQ